MLYQKVESLVSYVYAKWLPWFLTVYFKIHLNGRVELSHSPIFSSPNFSLRSILPLWFPNSSTLPDCQINGCFSVESSLKISWFSFPDHNQFSDLQPISCDKEGAVIYKRFQWRSLFSVKLQFVGNPEQFQEDLYLWIHYLVEQQAPDCC